MAQVKRWVRQGLIALVAGCLAAAMLAACSVLFDEGPLPPTRRVRQDLVQEVDELKRQIARLKSGGRPQAQAPQEVAPSARVSPPIEKAETWQKAAELLPKDKAGNIDWMKALQTGTVLPRPGLDSRAPERMVMDLEVELASARSKLFWVNFTHESHTEWLSCKNCHRKIYPLKRGAAPAVVTMAEIKAGQSCGACHGSVAFGIKDECARCHVKVPTKSKWRPSEEPRKPIERAKTWEEAAKLLPMIDEAPDWAKALADGVIAPRWGIDPKAEDEEVLPSDVELEPAEESPGQVTFSHESHTAILTCINCHREMEKSDEKTVFIGTHDDCEVCHGTVAFGMDTCERCHKEAKE
jgi:c(7)-type cytochrome triheme protein